MNSRTIRDTLNGLQLKRMAVMTNIVTVTYQDRSKSGKDRVYFDGKNNWQEAFYVGQKCNGVPPMGATIDADTSSKDFNGHTTWFLNRWKPVNQSAPQTSASAPPQKFIAGWDIPTGDLSRFVSNVIGSAIAAGLIEEPQQLMVWVAGAYRAAESLRSGKVEDFNDPIPQFHEDQGRDDEDFDGDSKIPF